MKLLPFIALALMTLVSNVSAAEPNPPARPPGIEESQWSPISGTLGFVVTKDAKRASVTDPATGKKRTVIMSQRVMGYFMILREGVWCRVEIEPSAVQPMPLTIAR